MADTPEVVREGALTRGPVEPSVRRSLVVGQQIEHRVKHAGSAVWRKKEARCKLKDRTPRVTPKALPEVVNEARGLRPEA